jgi:hypothetical protein
VARDASNLTKVKKINKLYISFLSLW